MGTAGRWRVVGRADTRLAQAPPHSEGEGECTHNHVVAAVVAVVNDDDGGGCYCCCCS